VRVFLTGGTGLIGSHVAERLRARGDEVVALHRPDSDVRFLTRIGCTLVVGDIRDVDGPATHMLGCEAVVHGAALVYSKESWSHVHEINVEGTANVVRAASLRGVPHVIHISSVAVYGRAQGAIDEDSPTDTPLAPGDLYARSKREAEEAARREAEAAGIKLTVLRPAAVYGERDRLLSTQVAGLVRRPLVPLLGNGRNTLPVVYAGNVASAVQRCLDNPPRRSPRTYDVGFDHPLTQNELVRGIARALGTAPSFVHIPAALVRGAANLGERLGLTVPGAGDLSLSRFSKLALGDNPYPSLRIRHELDWAPAFKHEEGLARTGAWLKEEWRSPSEDGNPRSRAG
jgi:nucleoside-diphosphate-sugar epimerase